MNKTAAFFAWIVIGIGLVILVALSIAAFAFGLILLVPVGIIGGSLALKDWIMQRREVKTELQDFDEELKKLLKEGK